MRSFKMIAAVTSMLAFQSLASAQNAAPAPAPSPALSSEAAASAPPPVVTSPGLAPTLKGPTVWGMLPWGGMGVGGRVMFPLKIGPLLGTTSVKDSFALEAGVDLLHWSYDFGSAQLGGFSYNWTEVLPLVGIMWNLWFSEQFALYPKIDLGYAFGWMSGWNSPGPKPTYGGFFVSGDVGAMYRLASNNIVLRAEVGSSSLKLGAGWLF